MRLFLGGSQGLVLYEDEELTKLHSQPVLSAVRPSPGHLAAGCQDGSVLVWDGNGDARVAARNLGRGVQGLAVGGKGSLIAGVIPAGVLISKDQGKTWSQLAGFSEAPNHQEWTAPWGTPLVSAIGVHPKNPKIMYCGVEVGGVYRTQDSGKTWIDLNIPVADVHSVQVCPARHERVYVTTGQGSFCTDDEGSAWRPMGVSNARQYTMGLAAHPTEADRVIISAAGGPPPTWNASGGARCDIYLSTDSGRRFRTVVKGLIGGVHRKALVINAKVPSEIVFGTSTGELYYSNDGGETFDLSADNLGDIRTIVFA
jgi:photosystem II stability/assembly factor-like uncharacterized protein